MDVKTSLTLDHIRALEAVSRTGSFSLAGRALFVSQPAISQRIHQLELVLGQPVLRRGQGQASALTPAGEAVVRLAGEVDRLLNEFFDEVDRMRLATGGIEYLTVACGPGSARHILPPIIQELSTTRSGVKIRVMQASGESLNSLVREGTAELGIQVEHLVDPAFHQVELISDHPVLVLHPRYPGGNTLQTHDDLERFGAVSFTRTHNFRMRVERWAADVGIRLNTILESDNLDIVKDWISKQLGVGFLPHFAVADDIRRGTLRTVAVDPAPQAAHMKVVFLPATITKPVVHSFLTIASQMAEPIDGASCSSMKCVVRTSASVAN